MFERLFNGYGFVAANAAAIIASTESWQDGVLFVLSAIYIIACIILKIKEMRRK